MRWFVPVAASVLVAPLACAQTLDLGGPGVDAARGLWTVEVAERASASPDDAVEASLLAIAGALVERGDVESLVLAGSLVRHAGAIASIEADPLVRAFVEADLASLADALPETLTAVERGLRDALAPLTGVVVSQPGRQGWFGLEPPREVEIAVLRDRVRRSADALSTTGTAPFDRLFDAAEAGLGAPVYDAPARRLLADLADAMDLFDPPGWLSQESADRAHAMVRSIGAANEPVERAHALRYAAAMARLLGALDGAEASPAIELARRTFDDRIATGSFPSVGWMRVAREATGLSGSPGEREMPDELIRPIRPAWVAAKREETQARAALLTLLPRLVASDSSLSDPAVLAAVRRSREAGGLFDQIRALNALAWVESPQPRPVAHRDWRALIEHAGELTRNNPPALGVLLEQAERFAVLPGEASLRATSASGSVAGWSPALGVRTSVLLEAIDLNRAAWRDAWAEAERAEHASEQAASMDRIARLCALVWADHVLASSETDPLGGWPGWPMSDDARSLMVFDLRRAVNQAADAVLGGDVPAEDEDDPLAAAEALAATAVLRAALVDTAVASDPIRRGGGPGDSEAAVALALVALGPPSAGWSWLADERRLLAEIAAATEQRVAAIARGDQEQAEAFAALASRRAAVLREVLTGR